MHNTCIAMVFHVIMYMCKHTHTHIHTYTHVQRYTEPKLHTIYAHDACACVCVRICWCNDVAGGTLAVCATRNVPLPSVINGTVRVSKVPGIDRKRLDSARMPSRIESSQVRCGPGSFTIDPRGPVVNNRAAIHSRTPCVCAHFRW